jgi:hypothetical protein
MKDEALDLALEALDIVKIHFTQNRHVNEAITAIKQARALDKKADNARELGLDYEPVLKDNSNYRYDPPVAEPVQSCYCSNCEAMGKELAALKAQQPVQEPVGTYGEIYESMQALLRSGLQRDQQIYMEMKDKPLYTNPPAQPAPVQDIEHCIWARNGNTPCPHTTPPAAQPAVPDALTSADIQEHIEYVAGWNNCRQAMMEMMK